MGSSARMRTMGFHYLIGSYYRSSDGVGVLMEGELIFVGFIMLAGQIIMLQMWNANWFKKENFKIKKRSMDGENRLRLKKLERDLGLKASPAPKEAPGMFDTIRDLAPLLKNLDPDQIGALTERFLGGSEEGAEGSPAGGGISDVLMNFAESNPEMVQSFLKGIGGAKDGAQTEEFKTQV